MATIVPSPVGGSDSAAVITTVLTGSDDFAYVRSFKNVLILSNPTAAPIQPTIIGAEATTRPCPGVGNIDVSAGKLLTEIPAGGEDAIVLNNVEAYLVGATTVENGAGLEAKLIQVG